VRAFDRMMPAFGEALDAHEIDAILRHLRGFCDDDSWPRGEFNLPRPLYTEKAFPEDEAVVTTDYDTGEGHAYQIELLYERRFGSRHMLELALPLVGLRDAGGRADGLGDVAIGYKYAVHHDLAAGHIVSLGGEVILPTGRESEGLGSGSTVLEPFVTWGWLLGDAFAQAHAFAELPMDRDRDDEAGLRLALGSVTVQNSLFRALVTEGAPETGVLYHDSRGQNVGPFPTVFDLPLLKPPYGQVVAVDLKTGEHLWAVPHGNTPESVRNNPKLQGVDIPNTGANTRGTGLLVTSTLLFGGEGGASPVLRAWDKKTGAIVAEIELPGSTTGFPVTYTKAGRQYLAVAVRVDGAVEIVALALPAAPRGSGRGGR
jgi:hypothetical protein